MSKLYPLKSPFSSVMSATVQIPACAHFFHTPSVRAVAGLLSHTPRPVCSKLLCHSGSDRASAVPTIGMINVRCIARKNDRNRACQFAGMYFDEVSTFVASL